MTQLSLYNTMCANTEILIDKRTDDLYEEAKHLFKDGFAIVSIDANDLPDEVLGEVVELLDFCYPEDSDEPLFDVSGVNYPVPMSALTCAY